MEGETMGGGERELERITTRLEQLATELEGDLEDDRAAELVREASELAAQAGRAVEGALHGAPEPPQP
jgi:hypothetical protein